MEKSVKICTIIANYNYARFIDKAIQSCIDQTVPNYIVVIDDCSTDGSVDIIRAKLGNLYSKKDFMYNNEKINIELYKLGALVLPPKNSGPSEARNIGLSLVIENFDFFQILDADDSMYPNKIERLIKEMEDQSVGVAYADYDIYDIDRNTTITEFKKPFSNLDLMNECIIHSGSLIRKETLKSVFSHENCKIQVQGFYDPNLRTCEDYDLWIRVMKKGWNINHVAESLTLVKNHQDNSTNSVEQETWSKNMQYLRYKHSEG